MLADGSILSGGRLWTLESLDHLDRYYLQNLDAGTGDFFSKLETQLARAPSGAKQLAAEIIWILYLAVSESGLLAGTKRMHIKRVWEWSGEAVPDAPRYLGELLEQGVASPGTGFHTNKWREFGFAIELMRDWKRLPEGERQRLIGEPWGFAEWMDGLPSAAGRQFRHMLLYLIFPEHFERMVSGHHKRRALEVFVPRLGLDLGALNLKVPAAVDRALFELRPAVEEHFASENFDYYAESVRDHWMQRKPEAKPAVQPPPPQDLDSWYTARFDNARVWTISAGEGARLWPDFQNNEIVAIGWDYLNDLTEYRSREAVHTAIAEAQGGNPWNDSLATWQFAHEMKPGDHVIVKQGSALVLGYGVVSSEYRFDDGRAEYQHTRDVDWKITGRWLLPEGRRIASKTLTLFTPYQDWLHWFFSQLEGEGEANGAESAGQKEYTVDDALQSVFLSADEFTRILDTLARKKNAILEGPPGVGKTFLARRIAWSLIGARDPERVQLVQLHQSYAYEDFIQGWRPQAGGGFTLRDGVFHHFCRRAQADPERKYVFIIDEINRGNLSKIFGELMMLIEADKRGPDFAIPLTYAPAPEEKFYVPENLYILGLMNTADRSLALVDYALRRRFGFLKLTPQFESDGFANHLIGRGVDGTLVARIVERMTALNQTIVQDGRNLGPGFEIGHSFFVPTDEEEGRDEQWYEAVVRQEIEPLLLEYWFDQPETARERVRQLLA